MPCFRERTEVLLGNVACLPGCCSVTKGKTQLHELQKSLLLLTAALCPRNSSAQGAVSDCCGVVFLRTGKMIISLCVHLHQGSKPLVQKETTTVILEDLWGVKTAIRGAAQMRAEQRSGVIVYET